MMAILSIVKMQGIQKKKKRRVAKIKSKKYIVDSEELLFKECVS